MRRALLLVLLAASPPAAQTPLTSDAPVFAAPNGGAIGTLKRGASVRASKAAGDWTMVILDGWITSSRLGSRKDSLDRVVTGSGPALLRVADGATQPVVAELAVGTQLKRIADRNGWTQVRRFAWVRSAAARRGATTASPPPASRASDADAPQGPAGASAQRAMRPTTLRASPGGDERATIRAGTAVEALARDGGWVRVRIEGWVPERDLLIADSAADASLTAADLRAEPTMYRGKMIRWDVQVISLQRADPLRKGLAPDEPYLIARAPGADGQVIYLAVPPSLLDQARAIPQLTTVSVTARVREGRSEPVGVPILDLVSFTRKQ